MKRKWGKWSAAGGLFLAGGCLLLIGSVCAEHMAIGQTYQSIFLDGEFLCCTAKSVNTEEVFHEARRELAQNTQNRLCMDVELSVQEAGKPFVHLTREEELKEQLKAALDEKTLRTAQHAYTVAIADYRGNFFTMEEAAEFLNQVRAKADEANAYTVSFEPLRGQIDGILTAELIQNDEPTKETDNYAAAGVCLQAAVQLSDAMRQDAADAYETGILDMDFVESVLVYENYIQEDAFTTAEEAAAEVTKEKESNKIYVVESGDCLSVIALDYDTDVSDIMAWNGLENADALREGQELIIAVPEPDLKLRITVGEVYEEDYEEEPIIRENDSWYTNQEEVVEEGVIGHRERNDIVVYENGIEVSRELAHQKIVTVAKPRIVERGTVVPPTYIKPIAGGRFTSGFGKRWGRIHKGVDWACPVGTTVYASCAGTVIQASYNGGYGNNVVISHADGRVTRYAHNSKLLVKAGQVVEQGEPIALSGNTGRSTGPHVHFELYIGAEAVNPLQYIGN